KPFLTFFHVGRLRLGEISWAEKCHVPRAMASGSPKCGSRILIAISIVGGEKDARNFSILQAGLRPKRPLTFPAHVTHSPRPCRRDGQPLRRLEATRRCRTKRRNDSRLLCVRRVARGFWK